MITFIKKEDRYYFSDGENVVLLTEKIYNSLKNSISLPTTICFHNCPVSFIAALVEESFDERPDIHMQRIKREDVDSLDYEVSLTKTKALSGKGLS